MSNDKLLSQWLTDVVIEFTNTSPENSLYTVFQPLVVDCARLTFHASQKYHSDVISFSINNSA